MKYNTYLFHASQLPILMTNSRVKGQLSETTKTELIRLWVENEYGRGRDIKTKYTEKGILCEQDSINLLSKKLGKKFTKNTKTYTNDFLIGTPDIVSDDLYDIKTSWDLFTYVRADEISARKDYYNQLFGYMLLTGKEKGHIAYCLPNTPKSFITDELYRMSFQMNAESTEYKEIEKQVIKNMTFDDIPENKRVKIFTFEMDNELKEEIKNRVIEWKNYLNSLTL